MPLSDESPAPARLLANPQADRTIAYGPAQQRWLNLANARGAQLEIISWQHYAPTPLRELPGCASITRLGRIWYKDEATRFGLGSFKALGGAYALGEQIRARLGSPVSLTAAGCDPWANQIGQLTAVTATDGNHGRSLAWGAQQWGCHCRIYLHQAVSAGRAAAIARYGADIIRVPGNYDTAVRQAASDAARHDWLLISDTSHPGYTEIPSQVMQGYSVMVAEALAQLDGDRLTHVFVQAGVGGLAAAVCAHLWETYGAERPSLIVVEPERAACVWATAIAGKLVELAGDLETVMACLSSGHTSLVAWEILRTGADFFAAIPDAAAVDAMRWLADGTAGDRPIVAGESGAAGLAAVLALSQQPSARAQLGLDERARVLVFGTEGATDPEIYQQWVGRSPQAVAASGALSSGANPEDGG